MKRKVLVRLIGAAFGGLLAVAMQAAEIPKPEFYGLYIVADGKLYSVDSPDSELDKRRRPVRLARTEQDFKSGGGTMTQVPG